MVGVAGRTKACLACYRRRIRCDTTRPVCKRCLKADIECPGYRDTTFVSFVISSSGPQRLIEKTAQAGEEDQSLHAPSAMGSIMLCTSDDMCISYARSCLPHTWRDPSLWLLPATNGKCTSALIEGNLAQYACISLARTLFAYRFRQPNLLAQGSSLYRTVISIFQKQLSLPNTQMYKQMVEAAIALRAFDSFIPHNPKAWISHSLGIEALFDLIGPVACKDEIMRKSLERARPMVVMACLASQRGTIFAEEKWKDVPWSDCHARKQGIEYLIDIFVDLPAATLTKTNYIRSTVFDSMVRRLRQWKLTKFQKPSECLVTNVNSHALYLAVCTITLLTEFSSVLQDGHRGQCGFVYTVPSSDLMVVQQNTGNLLGRSDVLEWYHALMKEAYDIAHLYVSCKDTDRPPTEILVSLRQVWKMTRYIDCPITIGFGAIMTQIIGDSSAKLPLFLYTL